MDVHGVTNYYTYDANGDVLAEYHGFTNSYTPLEIVSTSNTYDALNRLTSSTAGIVTLASNGSSIFTGTTTATIYNALGQVAETRDANGNWTSNVYDPAGNLIETINPDGTETRTAYDADNRPVLTMDTFNPANGSTADGTQTVYDSLGRTIETEEMSGVEISVSVDSSTGIGTETIVSSGTVLNSSFTTYNPDGTIASATSPSGQVTKYTYYPNGQQETVTELAVPTWNATLGENVPTDLTTRYTYDADGEQLTVTDPLQNVTSNSYDAAGHVNVTHYANGSSTTSTYNAAGQLVYSTDQMGNTTTNAYDAAGDLIEVDQPQVEYEGTMTVPRTYYTYDQYGDEIEQTDANNHNTTFQFDALGRETKRTLPDGESETFTYNNLGQQATHVDFDGNVTSNTYDSLGRLSTVSYSPPSGSSLSSETVTYQYNNLGQIFTTSDASGVTTNYYDAQGNLIESDTPEGDIRYGYNNLNQRTSTWTGSTTNIASGTSATTYSYDSLGRLITTTETRLNGTNVSLPTTDSYDADGNLVREILPNGVTNSYTYNSVNDLTGVYEVNSSDTLLFSQTYSLRNDGLRSGDTEEQRQADGSMLYITNSWSYDNDGRLTGETSTYSPTNSYSYTNSFTYDLVGNQLTETHVTSAGNQVTTNLYNGDNELTSTTVTTGSTTNSYTTNSYDHNGSLISSTTTGTGAGTDTYGYDVRNKMVSFSNGTPSATYIYDDNGNRVEETIGESNSYYLTDNNNPTGYAQPIEVWTGTSTRASATLNMSYIIGTVVLGQADSSGNVSWYSIDGRGSTRALVSSSGNVTETFDYTADGGAVNFTPSSSTPIFEFGGDAVFDYVTGFELHGDGVRDSNGFVFTEMDGPQYANLRDPLTLNLTLLDGADPENLWDPSGHEEEEVLEATSLGEWLEEMFARGVLVAARIARPLIGFLTAGAAWFVNQGQNALEFLRGQGVGAISYIQQAFLHQQDIVTEEEAESGPIWNTFQSAKEYLNELISGSEENPEGIQWHHLVTQASNFSDRVLNSAANLVPTPEPIHEEISAFFSTRPDWLPAAFPKVQSFVTSLDWEEQYEIGLRVWQSAMNGGTRDDFAEIVKRFL